MFKTIPYDTRFEISRNGIILKKGHRVYPDVMSRGYLRINMRGGSKLVHRLVLETFVGPCPDKMECSHIDNNKLNNNLSNLCWESHADNLKRSRKLAKFNECPACGRRFLTRIYSQKYCSKNCVFKGHSLRGEKISEKGVFLLLTMSFVYGIKNADIARAFKISPQLVCDIIKGRTRHVVRKRWESSENSKIETQMDEPRTLGLRIN